MNDYMHAKLRKDEMHKIGQHRSRFYNLCCTYSGSRLIAFAFHGRPFTWKKIVVDIN